MKSPLTIGYNDLIQEQERILAYMEREYPARILRGSLHNQIATKRIQCALTIIRLLKKHKKDPQMDLNEAFNKIKGIKMSVSVWARDEIGSDPDLYTTPE